MIVIFGTKYWSHNEQYLFEKKNKKKMFSRSNKETTNSVNYAVIFSSSTFLIYDNLPILQYHRLYAFSIILVF